MFNRKSSVVSSQSSERQSGQTLLELVVVISISVVVIGALVFATIASLRNAQFSKNQLQATKLAQEGIERVRVGRDRNECVTIALINVNSWNGGSISCSASGSLWDYHISGDCEKEQPGVSSKCYFNVTSSGSLQNIGFSSTSFPQGAEGIPPAPGTAVFRRAIILSDDINDNKIFTDDSYQKAKKVTAIVKWIDFAGDHQSIVTTILSNQIQ